MSYQPLTKLLRHTAICVCVLGGLDISRVSAQTTAPARLPAYTTIGSLGPDCAENLLETVVAADTVTYIVSDVSSTNCKGRLAIQGPPLPPGTYSAAIKFRSGAVASTTQPFIVDVADPTVPVYALHHAPTSTHFVTASVSDRTALLAAGWVIADAGFRAWPANGPAPSTSKPVCRFFFPEKATHFYSANESDCARLKRTSGFVDEGIAFRALVPFGGRCGPGTRPVYRVFNGERVNHRYTASVDTVSGMLTSFTNGFFALAYPSPWADEGIAFCSPVP